MPAAVRPIVVPLFLFVLVAQAGAQPATVRGKVTDGQTGNPLAGAHVSIRSSHGQLTGMITDQSGFFITRNLDPGSYTFRVSFVGYRSYVETILLAAGQDIQRQVVLEVGAPGIDELVVEGDRGGSTSNGVSGLTTIGPADLARVPIPDVNTDLAGYMMAMPGVVTAGDRGGQLYVRGGTPTQNLFLIDGIPVYQPFHIIGFFSAFPGDVIGRADVYAGGFGARFGGRLSSVIDVAARNGNKNRYTGSGSVAPFLTSLRLEGPISPGKVSFLGSVRQSVIEHVAPDLLRQPLPYRFGDQFLKVHAYLNNTSSASATVIHTFDEGNLAATDDSDLRIYWENLAYGARYIYLPEEYPVLTELAIAITSLKSEFGPEGATLRDASVDGFDGQINFAYLLGQMDLNFGIFVHSFNFDFSLEGAGQEKEADVEGGGYVESRLQVHPTFELRPGFRFHSFPSKGRSSFEPRMRATWRPMGFRSKHRLTAAWGVYRQEIVGLNDQRDVGAVFTAWTGSPENEDVPSAVHSIVGWESTIFPWLNVGVEGYLKSLSNLTVFTGSSGLRRADGDVRGIDVRAEITRPFFYGFIGYSLSSVEYQVAAEEGGLSRFSFRPPHDRRHHLNLIGRIVKGPYSLGIRWEYGSGFPFTRIEGFFNAVNLRSSDRGFLDEKGEVHILFDEPFGGLMPSYHRLDVTLERSIETPRFVGTVQIGLLNAYDRSNIFYFDLFATRRVEQLPLVPMIGFKAELR